tara:strand:+ start:508 stop:2574 length:2067 start_codon:yes stop_codon:yes gene_type:complete
MNAMGRPYTTRILVPIDTLEPTQPTQIPEQRPANDFGLMVTDAYERSGGWPGQGTTPQPTTPPDWRDSFVGRAPPRAKKKDVTTVIKKSEDPSVATTETITIKGGLMEDVPTGQDDPQDERSMGMWDADMAQLRARQQQGTAIAPEAEVRSIAGLANTQQEWDAQQAGRNQRLPPPLQHALNRGDKRAMIAAGNIGLEQRGLDPTTAVGPMAGPVRRIASNIAARRAAQSAATKKPYVPGADVAEDAASAIPRRVNFDPSRPYAPVAVPTAPVRRVGGNAARERAEAARRAAERDAAARASATIGPPKPPPFVGPPGPTSKVLGPPGKLYTDSASRAAVARRASLSKQKLAGGVAAPVIAGTVYNEYQNKNAAALAAAQAAKAKEPVGGSGYQQWDEGVQDSVPHKEESKAAAKKQIQDNPNLAKIWGKFADDPAARKKAYLANRKDLFKKAMLLNLIAVMTGGESQAAAFLESKMAEFDQLELFDQEARLNNQWREVFTDAEGNFYMPKSQEEAAERGAKAGFSPKEMKQLFTAVPKKDSDKTYAPSNTAKMIAEMDVLTEEAKVARAAGNEDLALQIEDKIKKFYTNTDTGNQSTNFQRVWKVYESMNRNSIGQIPPGAPNFWDWLADTGPKGGARFAEGFEADVSSDQVESDTAIERRVRAAHPDAIEQDIQDTIEAIKRKQRSS